jgi:hypothetical protein
LTTLEWASLHSEITRLGGRCGTLPAASSVFLWGDIVLEINALTRHFGVFTAVDALTITWRKRRAIVIASRERRERRTPTMRFQRFLWKIDDPARSSLLP